jgi:RNA recognition motif-containing protein
MNIYVGNLSRSVTEEEVRDLFQLHGTVESVTIIRGRVNHISKGFGFVEMPDERQALGAIRALQRTNLKGIRMEVRESKPMI